MNAVVVDYKMGNSGSIVNMLKRAGFSATITSDHNIIEKADRLILPGVGSFDRAMLNLDQLKLKELLNYKVLERKTPVLGICLGMQLFALGSEEGQERGLSWIDGVIIKFGTNDTLGKLKIPHMGWNTVAQKKTSKLFDGMFPDPRFYFVHSYHFHTSNKEDILCTTLYGTEFISAFARDNILGVQFHPEKSHKYGMKLLENFIKHY